MVNTKEIWKEIIKLQYQNKSIEEIKAYKDGKITWEDLLSAIYSLNSSNLLDFVEWGENECKYYIIVPEYEDTDTFPHKGITINDKNLEGEDLREYLTSASTFLSGITAYTKPLDGTNPPPANVELIREKSRIDEKLKEYNKQVRSNLMEY